MNFGLVLQRWPSSHPVRIILNEIIINLAYNMAYCQWEFSKKCYAAKPTLERHTLRKLLVVINSNLPYVMPYLDLAWKRSIYWEHRNRSWIWMNWLRTNKTITLLMRLWNLVVYIAATTWNTNRINSCSIARNKIKIWFMKDIERLKTMLIWYAFIGQLIKMNVATKNP